MKNTIYFSKITLQCKMQMNFDCFFRDINTNCTWPWNKTG